MKTMRLQIDLEHTKKILRGEPVTIKVPEGATRLELRFATPRQDSGDSIAKILDVFFNGRPA